VHSQSSSSYYSERDGFTDENGDYLGTALLGFAPWLRPASVIAEDGYLSWPTYGPSHLARAVPEAYVAGWQQFRSQNEARVDPPHALSAGRHLLQSFLNLDSDDVSASAFADFANQWGVLGICRKHELLTCRRCLSSLESSREPISKWRELARCFAAIGRLNRGAPQLGDLEALREADLKVTREMDYAGDRKREIEIRTVRVLRGWLAKGGANMVPVFVDGSLTLRIGGSLLGSLSMELSCALSGNKAIAVCSGCARLHFRARAPKTGQRTWCSEKECQLESRNRKSGNLRTKR
jgi:hypothetical protein